VNGTTVASAESEKGLSMDDRHYQLSEEQLRRAEGCVQTIAEALEAFVEPSAEQESSVRQIREANLLISLCENPPD
jgi:hypothetical protein